jgi:hypothetical protein
VLEYLSELEIAASAMSGLQAANLRFTLGIARESAHSLLNLCDDLRACLNDSATTRLRTDPTDDL